MTEMDKFECPDWACEHSCWTSEEKVICGASEQFRKEKGCLK